MQNRAHNRNQTHLFGEMNDTQHAFELLERDYYGSTGHEPGECGLGEKINDEAQSDEEPVLVNNPQESTSQDWQNSFRD